MHLKNFFPPKETKRINSVKGLTQSSAFYFLLRLALKSNLFHFDKMDFLFYFIFSSAKCEVKRVAFLNEFTLFLTEENNLIIV